MTDQNPFMSYFSRNEAHACQAKNGVLVTPELLEASSGEVEILGMAVLLKLSGIHHHGDMMGKSILK